MHLNLYLYYEVILLLELFCVSNKILTWVVLYTCVALEAFLLPWRRKPPALTKPSRVGKSTAYAFRVSLTIVVFFSLAFEVNCFKRSNWSECLDTKKLNNCATEESYTLYLCSKYSQHNFCYQKYFSWSSNELHHVVQVFFFKLFLKHNKKPH